MKCQINKMTKCNFRIREQITEHDGNWYDLDIPEEIYEEIRWKLDGKPYTGIHREIMNSNRGQITDTEVLFDYLYCNGFDYLFEE